MRNFNVIILVTVFITTIFLGVDAMQLNSDNNQSVIILLGPPGSGKGTQAKRICQAKGLPHISTGDLFRYNINNETELGHKAKAFMNQGKLVPDDLVLDMLFDRVSQEDCKQGYLLDGFPRTIPQAESFDRSLPKGTNLVVINLEVSDEVIIKRISGRLSCRYCGNIQNRYFTPPKEEGKCDRCAGELYHREDDKPEVVKERLAVYNNQTAPLIEYYNTKGLEYTIDGELGSDVVYKKIMDLLDLE